MSDKNYIFYLESKLNQVDDRMTSLEAALSVALMNLNRQRVSERLGVREGTVSEETYLKLRDVLGPVNKFSVDTNRKITGLYGR